MRGLPIALWCAAQFALAQSGADTPRHASDSSPTACAALARDAVARPVHSDAQRQLLLERLEGKGGECASDAAFLAVLGRSWLDHGRAEIALLWLERALLIDPDALAVRVDHALALQALGQATALAQLRDDLRSRDDLPPGIMQRLDDGEESINRAVAALAGSGWRQRGEIALRWGHENNLDRSPVLEGITLTSPDGPIELPLAVPIRPRSGAASVFDAGWRLGYDSGQGGLSQLSIAGSARSAPGQSSTNYQLVQARFEHWRAVGETGRLQAQLGYGSSGGNLSEPYRVARAAVAGELDVALCTYRLSVEAERRSMSQTAIFDGDIRGLVGSMQCRLPVAGGWLAGIEWRGSRDEPRTGGRPGGSQTQGGVTLKVGGRWRSLALELSADALTARDSEGYSPLLEDNARRRFKQEQLSIELAYRLPAALGGRPELFLQWSRVSQRSNLTLFAFDSTSQYGGLRWRW